jgi:dienelactone hydrolase
MLLWLAACGGSEKGAADTADDATVDPPTGTIVTGDDCPSSGYFEPEGWYEVLSLGDIEAYEVPEEDMRYMLYVPENPKAWLWVFHGTGGDIGNLQQVEYLRVYNPLIADGYAIAATESLERGGDAQWDHEASSADENIDMVRIKWLRDYLVDTTALEDTTPMFAMGFSNGAEFAGTFTYLGIRDYGWDIRGADLHSGSPASFAKIDTWHQQAENDTVTAERGYDGYLEEAPKQEHTFVIHPEVLLDPMRMISIGFDEAESQAVFDELLEMGFIDAAGERTFDIGEVESVLDTFMAQSTTPAADKVGAVLRVVWATHRVNGDFHRDIRNLFTCDNL